MNIGKEKAAISYLRAFQPQNEPYYLCYSGGKDSDCVRILAQLAGVEYDLVHNLTTVDAPETVQYVKSVGAEIQHPPKTMWRLIVEKGMPPTRIVRYCCSCLKEKGGKGRVKVTGVRRAESSNRAANCDFIKIVGKPKTVQRAAAELGAEFRVTDKGGLVLNGDNAANHKLVEEFYTKTSTTINPIVDWTDEDVWEFLHYHGCESNPLYKCGYKRIGCVGCPMASRSHRIAEFERYPIYRANYIRAFERMLKRGRERGIEYRLNWQTAEDVMDWWLR